MRARFVIRGGAWHNSTTFTLVAYLPGIQWNLRFADQTFRLVRRCK